MKPGDVILTAMKMRYNPEEKPDPTVCPRQFCFFWQPSNHWQRGRTAEERLYATEGKCLCEFGLCTRLDAERGDRDWYESDGPDLAEAGLPWFYFYASPASITERNGMREKYINDSEALWGREQQTNAAL